MAKFAIHCRVALSHTVRRLSRTLGPDTLELQARFGIHSGPVTAGVLRGERGRFQLFGDTVNTAARMESTGLPDKIQISASVQVLLRDDKSFEIETRGLVSAKGKGSLQTFWLVPTTSNVRSLSASISDDETTPVLPVVPIKPSRALQWGEKAACDMEKTARLVDWVVELLASHLNEVVAKRRTKEGDFLLSEEDNGDENFKGHPLDQFQDYIDFPPYEPSESIHTKQELGIEVLLQLREFVTTISLMVRLVSYYYVTPHCFSPSPNA
mgnify:CR=1 FL=1